MHSPTPAFHCPFHGRGKKICNTPLLRRHSPFPLPRMGEERGWGWVRASFRSLPSFALWLSSAVGSSGYPGGPTACHHIGSERYQFIRWPGGELQRHV